MDGPINLFEIEQQRQYSKSHVCILSYDGDSRIKIAVNTRTGKVSVRGKCTGRLQRPDTSRSRKRKRRQDEYKRYLASAIWRDIRTRVLRRDKAKCCACGNVATEVHHRRYDTETMKGTTLVHLVSICSRCHNLIEFSEGGRKRSLRSANQRLDKLINGKDSTAAKDGSAYVASV